MPPVFIDTNIPMYAAGASHPLKKPSQRVILAIATGEIDAVTDTEVFQEILYRYIHISEREKGFKVFDHFHRIMMGRILPYPSRNRTYSKPEGWLNNTLS